MIMSGIRGAVINSNLDLAEQDEMSPPLSEQSLSIQSWHQRL